jgi:hypothetical protein
MWTAVFATVAGIGIAIAAGRRSRAWILTGIAYTIGGIGYAMYFIVVPDPPVGTAADIGVWFGIGGFLFLFAATVLTLVAIGRRGRHRFLVLFAAATLVVATYEFWTSNWAARTGDVPTRCVNTGHNFGPRSSIQRVPPGVRCSDPAGQVFVPADAICWLALAGWSVFYGFVVSFPLMGLTWVVRRRPAFALP